MRLVDAAHGGRAVAPRPSGAAAYAVSPADPLRATARTRVPCRGEKVTLRRVTCSAPRPAGRSVKRRSTVSITTRISNSANAAPRQRRTPPPNGHPRVGRGRVAEEPLGPERVRLGVEVGPRVREPDRGRHVAAGRERQVADPQLVGELPPGERHHRPQPQRLGDHRARRTPPPRRRPPHEPRERPRDGAAAGRTSRPARWPSSRAPRAAAS